MSPSSREPGDLVSPAGAPSSVRPVRADDVAYAVALHLAHLQLGLFPRLGRRFLTAYYRGFMDSPYGVGLLAIADGGPVGVVVGSVGDRDHYAWLLRRRGVRLVAWGLLGLMRRPRLLVVFLRTRARRYARGAVRLLASRPDRAGNVATYAGSSPAVVATLAHIVVGVGHQRSGAGRLLAEAFVEQARAAGCAAVRVVAAADDERAERFYTSLGWTAQGEAADLDGTRLRRYHRWLDNAPAGGSREAVR